MAFLIRHSGFSFDHVVFGMFLVCLWATIFAAWHIAQACFDTVQEQIGAILLVALWMSLPVAGTSLMLIDPYLTARSLSTPLVLFGIASALRAGALQRSGNLQALYRHLALTTLLIGLAAVFHPLMAGYGATFILSIVFLECPRPRSKVIKAICLFASGMALAAAIQIFSPLPSAAIRRVALTRSYWFLSRWEWFEILGLLAPLSILIAILAFPASSRFRSIARSAVTVGITAIAISLYFARPRLPSFGVSHLQPLRIFQLIYFTLFLRLGAWLARMILHDVWWRWVIAIFALGAPAMIPGWFAFPHSAHIEPPSDGSAASEPNRWVEAFRWVRQNTPVDTLFAVDANYISDPNEDAQSFRAITERSVLPDYSKDGGEAAVNPALSDEWVRGVDAQQSLSSESDAARLQKLSGFGVTWMVLQTSARTSFNCPHDNGTVKVCKLSASAASR